MGFNPGLKVRHLPSAWHIVPLAPSCDTPSVSVGSIANVGHSLATVALTLPCGSSRL